MPCITLSTYISDLGLSSWYTTIFYDY